MIRHFLVPELPEPEWRLPWAAMLPLAMLAGVASWAALGFLAWWAVYAVVAT